MSLSKVTDITKGEVHGENGAYVAGAHIPGCLPDANGHALRHPHADEHTQTRTQTRARAHTHTRLKIRILGSVRRLRRALQHQGWLQRKGQYSLDLGHAHVGARCILAPQPRVTNQLLQWQQVHAEPCPRSRTRHSAAKPDGSYDVAIIGAGCIGSAIARELAKTDASVVVIEAADDVSQGATKGNSGIVHAGFDDKPGSVRAKFCWKGNQMFPELDNDLHFGYQLTGSLVVARSAEDEKHLHELIERGKSNGVKNLRIVREKELKQIEPHIHPDATAALFSPDAGTLIPYEYTIALAENAADNGVEFRIRREVTDICKDEAGLFEIDVNHWEPEDFVDQQNPLKKIAGKLAGGARSLGNYFGGPGENGPWDKFPALVRGRQHVDVEDMKLGGSGSKKAMGGVSVGKEKVRAKYIVNAAGGFSDKISAMIGDDSFKVKPRLGEYVLLRKNQGHLCNHILFPCPGPYGKGILVQKTLWGNLILGPTARDQHEWPDGKTDPDSKEDILGKILAACRGLVPDFDTNESIHSFSGARSKTDLGNIYPPGAPA